MNDLSTAAVPTLEQEWSTAARIARSAAATDSRYAPNAGFHRWFADRNAHAQNDVRPIPLDALVGWSADPSTGNLAHDSGKFFTVEGLDVQIPDSPVPHWTQPIINQPELGILGVLAKEFGGVLHFLMQGKVEPGNVNGVQLSPTVQATRSNYTRVHAGRSVPYLEYFRQAERHRILTDVRQSEQGSWFYRKRNRNMVVEVTEDVEVLDGFHWLTLGQLHALLRVDDVVNMDARTVLACLPFSGDAGPLAARPTGDDTGGDDGDDGFRAALLRSCAGGAGEEGSTDGVLRWLTGVRSRSEVLTSRIPLNALEGWHRTEYAVAHDTGRFFELIAVDVRAGSREVQRWTQPMIRPCATGIVAFLVKRVDGVLKVLVHALVEPGYLDVAELSPTVQCTPENFGHLPPAALPPLLDVVREAGPERIRFDATLSEEGGRFFHARNRYVIVEVGSEDLADFDHPDYHWMTMHQLADLLRHSHYVNIQARSLVACLHSLSGRPPAA
ncbi:NDP-hexose 2,3-dehydratase family protein [Streptomyces sp. NPDC056503]|uniref:NDP-hexose 2,3-dehydratase family protein n=1 Tax=Streptomyces sp. NPDC056503 TaxID=3345842 RepID=UPI0036C34E12